MASSNTDRITRDEAYDLYMQIFGEFALGFGDVEAIDRTKAVVEAINVRLADAGSQQTIVVENVNGAELVWQCFQTYDHWTEEQAAAAFNQAWSAELVMDAIAPKPKAARPSTSAPATQCRCGCKQATNKGKGYLPGHDARHAGQVARAILGDASTAPEVYLSALPTPALRAKALAQVARGNAKAAVAKVIASAPSTSNSIPLDGYITHNRERIPAQTFQSNGEQRMNINDAADGSGDWLDAEGYAQHTQAYWLKRFTPGPIPAPATPRKRAPRKPKGDGPEALKSLFTF